MRFIKYFRFINFLLIIIFSVQQTSNLAFAGHKKRKSKSSTSEEARLSTANLVTALDNANQAEEARSSIPNSSSGGGANSGDTEAAENKDTENYVRTGIKLLSGNDNADWIFKTSTESIKLIFKNEEASEDTKSNKESNMIRTLKQTACVFIAETHYGNLSDGKTYDKCDQTNIGQIRPPAYKAIYNSCSYTESELAFLGKGTNCQTLHPYEMPLCCEALYPGEAEFKYCEVHKNDRKKQKAILKNDPLSCISLQKRQFLEKADAMSSTSMETEEISDGKVLPIKCKSTYGKTYIRIPAFPEHSVFASIFYLKLVGYKPMTDQQFASFGAVRYNGASSSEQRSYQHKLNSCLKVLNTKESTDVFESTYKRALNNQSSQVSKVPDKLNSTEPARAVAGGSARLSPREEYLRTFMSRRSRFNITAPAIENSK
jgi:hypothetical protein